jgi:hypothetical protein
LILSIKLSLGASRQARRARGTGRSSAWQWRTCLEALDGNLGLFELKREGGKIAAILRSFVASCQCVGVDPFAWLKDIRSRIAGHPITRIAELLPHNWALVQG